MAGYRLYLPKLRLIFLLLTSKNRYIGAMLSHAKDDARGKDKPLVASAGSVDEVAALVSRAQAGDLTAFDSIMALDRERLYSVI